jgi:predicted metalloprotease
MLTAFLNNAEELLLALIILVLAIACGLLLYFRRQDEKERRAEEAEKLTASQEIKRAAETIINSDDADVRDYWTKRLQSKGKDN